MGQIDGDRPAGPLRVAVAQAPAVPLDLAGNASTAARLVRAAAAAGAELVVFPELFLTGYEPGSIAADPARHALAPGDGRLAALQRACRETACAAIAGAPAWAEGALRISAVVIDPGGEQVARYDKQHLDADERAAGFVGGEAGCTLVLRGWRLGLGICWDTSFPEHARAAAVAGCHAYLAGTMFKEGPGELKRAALGPARAIENSFYVAFANHSRRSGPFDGCGRSAVWGPDGTLLADAGRDAEAIAVATFVPDVLERARSADLTIADPSLFAEGAARDVVRLARRAEPAG